MQHDEHDESGGKLDDEVVVVRRQDCERPHGLPTVQEIAAIRFPSPSSVNCGDKYSTL